MAPQTRARSAATAAKATSADPTVAKATSTKPKNIQHYSRRAKSPLIGPKMISDEEWKIQRKVFHSQVDAYERIVFKHLNSGILPFNFLGEMAHEPWLSERRQPVPRQPEPEADPGPKAASPPQPEAASPPQPDPEPEAPSPPQPDPEPEAPSPQPDLEPEAPSPQPNPEPEAPSPPQPDPESEAPSPQLDPESEAPSPQPDPEPEAASITNTRRRLKRKQASKDNTARRVLTRSAAALNAPSDQPSAPTKKRLRRQQRNDAGPDHLSELEDELDDEQHESDDEQHESDDEQQPSVDVDDDGARRCRLQHTFRSLKFVGEALTAAGAELDAETVQSVVETRRIHRKNKDEPRRGRGLGKPRDPAPPSRRPTLKVVADYLFTPSVGTSTQLKTTIRLLTLESMPGPYRTYNMFPLKSRLSILSKFLLRYTWAPGEHVSRCLEVYENIASDVYGQELITERKLLKKKYGDDNEEWKEHPPRWCRNPDYWKGLCDIWAKEKWKKLSKTNRENMTKAGPIVHHVGGSRSMYQHMQSLVSRVGDNGENVGMKDLFDATHMKTTPFGKIYVNDKAKKHAENFQQLRQQTGPEVPDEEIWETVVGGENRGRVFGLGKRSRVCKKTAKLQERQESATTPTKSTTTSATSQSERKYTREELEKIVNEKMAVQAQSLNEKMAAQINLIEQLQKYKDYQQECIEKLLQATGMNPPPFKDGPSRAGADSGAVYTHANANDGGQE